MKRLNPDHDEQRRPLNREIIQHGLEQQHNLEQRQQSLQQPHNLEQRQQCLEQQPNLEQRQQDLEQQQNLEQRQQVLEQQPNLEQRQQFLQQQQDLEQRQQGLEQQQIRELRQQILDQLANLQRIEQSIQQVREPIQQRRERIQERRERIEQYLLDNFSQSRQNNGLTPQRIRKFQHFSANESLGGEQCVVCMNDLEIGRQMVRLDCHVRHYLCKVCADTWFKDQKTCPFCRHEFN